MNKNMIIRDESGIALVIALVMLLALTVIGVSAMMTSTMDIQISGNERRAAETLQIADAGIERSLMDLLNDFKSDADWSNNSFKRINLASPGTITNALAANTGTVAACNATCIDAQWGDPFGSDGITGGTGNAVDLYGGAVDFGGGKYRVLALRQANVFDEVYVRSYAEHSTGARKIIQMHLALNQVDAWRNAVFAGRGSASATINGNINVAGSVHVLGTGATNNWTISGNASITNGYDNLASSIKDKLLLTASADCPYCGLDMVGTFNGKNIYSLDSEFRVKNVQVGITGSGNIGELGDANTDSDGDGVNDLIYDSVNDVYYQAKLDAIYANKIINGSAYYANEVKMPAGYDLGDKLQMPTMQDAYDPATQTNLDGDICPTCDTYEDFINWGFKSFDASTLATSCTLAPGAGGTPDFTIGNYNAVTGACEDSKGCLVWDNDASSGQNLKIEGKLKFTGCPSGLTIAPGPSSKPSVTYSGKGILFTENNITVNRGLEIKAGDKFIEDDLMAVMTTGNMSLAESAGAVYMGAFYAGNAIGTTKGGGATPTSIIGAMVSNWFCMGSGITLATGACGSGGNAADVYYTPGISEELTKVGMLKGRQLYTFDEFQWEEKY